jgi:hypothetical protein
MAQFFAHIPWWLTAILLLAGVILIVHGNTHTKPRLRSTGLTIVCIAVLLGVAWLLIDTDAEKCEHRTADLVSAADAQDWAKLQSLLDKNTQIDFSGAGNEAKWQSSLGPDKISAAAQAIAKEVGLHHVYIISRTTTQVPGKITVTLSAASLQDETQDRPYASGWEFDYQSDGSNPWHLQLIKLISLQNQTLNG